MLPTLAYMTCTEPGSQAKCRWLQTLFNGLFLLGGISLQAIPGARRSICYGQFLLFHLPKHGDTITCLKNFLMTHCLFLAAMFPSQPCKVAFLRQGLSRQASWSHGSTGSSVPPSSKLILVKPLYCSLSRQTVTAST